ncbi:MAG: ATP-binding protein [Lutibacter sp.]|jgi:ATP-dependent DNA helicase RecG
MLDSINLLSIVNSGEGYNAEFKVNLPSNLKSITEEICAFANASGGVVLIGVDDKNTIKGTKYIDQWCLCTIKLKAEKR